MLRLAQLASIGLFGAVAFIADPAHAVPVQYFGEDLNPTGSGRVAIPGSNSEAARNSFLSNLIGVGTETFESFSDGTGAPLALSFPGSSGSITATLQGEGSVDVITSGTSGAGRWPTSGDNYWTTNSTEGNFYIEFSEAVAAFGFFGTDVGDFSGQIELTLDLAGGGTETLTIPSTIGASNASLIFFGLINDVAFTRVSFSTTSGEDVFGFDDMTIGDLEQIRPPVSVPEPGMLALFGAGLAGLAMARRRKRS